MWLIVGTVPSDAAPVQGAIRVTQGELVLPDERRVPVARGTPALASTAWTFCTALGLEAPELLLAGDTGRGDGSRRLYAWLCAHLERLAPQGLTFHYLFPDVDWHNRVLMAALALPRRPLLVADAGFMYVAKMSGYAGEYELFTPDAGEMAFLADEKAPHPFYTRGFLLAEARQVPELLRRAADGGNCARHLIVKGAKDVIARGAEILATVASPSVPAMECIGGTGDIVTGLATALLAAGQPSAPACIAAARLARLLAALCGPTPETQAGELIQRIPELLDTDAAQEVLYTDPGLASVREKAQPS